MDSRRKKPLARVLVRAWITVSAILMGMVLSEVVIDRLVPIRPPRLDHPYVNQYVRLEHRPNQDQRTWPEEGLSGIVGPNRFTTNALGFRGPELERPKPADEFRVFVVGGSTTECYYVDDDDAITAVVQQACGELAPEGTQVRVWGAGVSGAASDDHVAMIGQRIVHLQPDLVVVFAGINDLTRSIYGQDPLHPTVPKAPRRPSVWGTLAKPRLVRMLLRRFGPRPSSEIAVQRESGTVSSIRHKVDYQRRHPPVEERPRTDPLAYEVNLRTIVGMALGHRFRLAFMTQASTWNSVEDPRAAEWSWMRHRAGRTFGEVPMDEALESLNDVMRRVGREEGVPVFDLARRIPKHLRYFYDDCHFNTEGSRRAGEMLAAFLVEEGLVPLAGGVTAEAAHAPSREGSAAAPRPAHHAPGGG